MKLTTYNNFLLVILLVFSTIVTAQNLTISNTGESGTSGTNWSIIGNVLYIGNSGSASINTSVISNHLLNTGNLLINLPWQSGVARNININNSIAYSGSVARTLTFQSANDIVFANAVGITSATASLNVVLRSTMGLSLGAPDNGLVKMDGINIDTKGGHFWVGGGTSSTTWNGLTVGNSYAVTWLDDVPGISLVGSTIATNGGNISMYAQSNNTSDDDGVNYGINFENSVMSSGTGSIYLAGGVYGRFNNGIGMRVNGTSATSITSTTGAITIYGYGTDATTNGNFWRNATMINGSVSIKSGSGNIAVTGEAAFASPVNDKEGLVIVDGSAICSQSGSITLRGTNTLETSGQYSNSIRFAAANIANSIRIGYDGTNAYSGNISIEGNSIYQRNTNAGGGSIAVQTTGILTIQPTGTAFTYMRAGNSGTLTYDDDWNFGTTLGGFTFGKTTNTTNITLSNPLTTDGPISIYGGNILAQQNITSTLPGADILLQATGAINLSASMTIQTNVGDVTLNATSGGTATIADSAIYLNSSSQILSNGGNITLGGGYSGSEGNLYAATTNVGGGYAVRMDAATILNAAGGNINIYGRNVLSYGDGIYLNAVVISTVGSGTIGIYGDSFGGFNGTTYFGGITFENQASTIQTVNGNLSLKGILTDSQSAGGYGINFYRSSGSTGQTRHIQLLSRTGAIEVTGDGGSTIGGGIGHSSWGNVCLGSPADASYTATGDVTISYSKLVGASANGFKVKTTGDVSYLPTGTSFADAQTMPYNANYVMADGASSLTIGKPTNTANITMAAVTSVAGPITVYGGTIAVNENLNTTAGNAVGDLLLKASGDISLAASKSITTAGGDVILWSDSDGNNDGMVNLNSSSLITTNAGHLWIGGGNGTSTWNGLTVGNGFSTGNSTLSNGVTLTASNINTAGGNIAIYGKSRVGVVAGGGNVNGIRLLNGNTINSGTGTIFIKGYAQGTGGSSNGIELSQLGFSDLITSANITASAIIIDGETIANPSNVNDAWGVYTWQSTIEAIAVGGGVTIIGKGTEHNGVTIPLGSSVLSKSGAIKLTGTGYGTGYNAVEVAGILGQKAGSSVTSSSSDITITGNTFVGTGNLATTGKVIIQSNDDSFSTDLSFPVSGFTIPNSITGLTLGKITNTKNITFGETTTIAGPIIAYGGTIAVNAALTATNSTINLTASTAATQTAAITANGLALNGAGTFTLENTANNIATIAAGSSAAKIGSLSFVDATGGLEIGTVNPTGITSTGPIKIETLEGNITLSENLATDDITADAIILNAGKTAAIGTRTGGNIIVSGTPTLTYGSGGRAKLFSGDNMNSTGLTTLVGGVGNTRVNVDETTATFSPVLANDISFALYRAEDLQAPTISNFNNISKMYYDGSYKIVAPTTNSLGAFSYTSSNTAVATISGTTVTILSAGTSDITANQAADASYASGSVTATLTVSSVSVLTNTGAISSTNLNYVNQYGQIGTYFGMNKNGKSIRTKTYDLTNGLVMHLDAGNAASYPGTGTIWTDLSGFGNNGTLVSGPTYNSSNSGYLVFNGTTTYVDAPLTKTASCTFSVWAKSTSAPSSMLFNAGNHGTGPDLFFSGGVLNWNTWDSSANPFGSIPATALNGNWHNYVVVNDAVSNITKLYYDGVLYGTAAYVNASATTALYIGGSSSQYQWNGAIGNFQVHNRVLTPLDVLENFNNLKTRYGL